MLAIIVGAQRIDRRIPGALLGLILSIVAVDALGLASHHGVAVLGTVHEGLPQFRLPSASWSQLRQLLPAAFTVAFVCIAQTAATVRASSARTSATSDFNRDLVGIGAGSVAAGLIGAFAVDASPPNTAIVTASAARSQLTHIVAAAVVLGVVVLATAPLAHLPEATLGATLVFIATKLFRVGELRTILRFDRLEFTLAAATLLAVALIGIEQGIALAMILSLADRTRRVARPRDAILGREPGTDHWIPMDIGRPTEQVPGVLVYLVYAPLWYGNADYFHLRVRQSRRRSVGVGEGGDSRCQRHVRHRLHRTAGVKGSCSELQQRGVTIAIARASHLVHHDLKHGALLEQLGDDRLFTSVEGAVTALQR